MNRINLLATALALFAGAASLADSSSPYAGEESRDIKALSREEIDGLLAGKGMGYAKSAELNGYPGPAHVLELADPLQLSAIQREQTAVIHARMQAAAREQGARLIEAERELEQLFRSREVTPQSLSQALAQVAECQARVRGAHLLAHVEQTQVLSRAQVARYIELRGYSGASGAHGDHRGHH